MSFKSIILLENQLYQSLTFFDFLITIEGFTLYIDQETYNRYQPLIDQQTEQEDWSLYCLFALSKHTKAFSIEPYIAPLDEALVKKLIKKHGEVIGVYVTAS